MNSQYRAINDAIYAEFLRSNSPNQNRRGAGFSSNINGDDNDISRSFEQSFGVSAPGKDPAIKHTLPCSLEELYQGATKRVKITREVADRRG
jgi:DnaJ-class molecular chaperone